MPVYQCRSVTCSQLQEISTTKVDLTAFFAVCTYIRCY